MVAAYLGLAVAVWCGQRPAVAGGQPRYAQRRVYGRVGPRMVIVAIPGVNWQDLRRADTPTLRKLTEAGAIGLMPVADGETADWSRTWVSLGAGRGAAGWPEGKAPHFAVAGGLESEIAAVADANERARTNAMPGALGARLHEYGLTTALVETKVGDQARAAGAAIAMDGVGRVDSAFLVPRSPWEGDDESRADTAAVRAVLRVALAGDDVVVVDIGPVRSEARDGPDAGRLTSAFRDAVVPPPVADALAAEVLRAVKPYDALVAVIVPTPPAYRHPTVEKSMGPVIWYETRHAQQGLLFTNLTRWPGVITAADFAPTVLHWWQIPGAGADKAMDGNVLSLRPGGAAAIDRLDRTLSDHYRWSFIAIPTELAFAALLIVLGMVALLGQRAWRTRLELPALALPLVPSGYLLAHRLGVGSLWSLLLVGFLFAFAVAYAASRARSTSAALAVSILAGAAVIALDTLTGNWTTRISAFGPPPLIGARYYGLGNEHMGFLVGLTVVGLAALWEWRAWRWGAVIGTAVAVTLLVSMPFWGANWGGGITAAFTFLLLWVLAVPHRWRRDVPIAAGLLLLTALLPGLIDLALSPGPQYRTHLGAAAATLSSGDHFVLRDIARRKVEATFGILFYTPLIPVLGIATFAAFWSLLRRGGPVATRLRGRPKLKAGIMATVIGGVVSSVVNDSGVAAGAGLWCAALAATLFVAARPEETVRAEGVEARARGVET